MDFLTTGKIAKRFGVDRDKVSYAIRKLRISPIGTAGQTKIYAKSSVEAVKAFLANKKSRMVI